MITLQQYIWDHSDELKFNDIYIDTYEKFEEMVSEEDTEYSTEESLMRACERIAQDWYLEEVYTDSTFNNKVWVWIK